MSIFALAFSQTNRGRIQAQGNNPVVEISQSWASNTVPTNSEGIVMLENLWKSLTVTQ